MKHDVGTGVADVSIQNEIYDIVNSHGKTEYRRIIEEKAGYPYVYHLADIRANLISWLPVKQTDAVLELGAECGALTEIFAEMSDDVTFWTDTRLQAEIIRCRLQKNVSGAEKMGKELKNYSEEVADLDQKMMKLRNKIDKI